MKKKIGIISVLLIVVIAVISTILLINKKDKKSINLDNGIAYYYETDNGNYTQGSSNAWSTGEYVLDIEQSNCNGENNPVDLIDWDPSNNGVLLKANENISCTLYFDKKPKQEKFFEDLLGKSGAGELLYHNSQLENGANDHSYRYSGDNPNNFICFGPGSESYNSGQSGQCPDGNLYRIIGYVPVELSTGKIEFRVKVIKSEYATHDDLEKEESDGTENFYAVYESLKRVKKEDSIETFNWNDEYDNIWSTSTLYKALNDNQESFFHKLDSNWASKIDDVQWNVGGINKNQLPKAKIVYDDEWDGSYGASSKVNAKIGLMYPSDYGFASEPKSWQYRIYMYDNAKDNEQYENNQNRENNWLFNSVYEWLISHYLDGNGHAFDIDSVGYVRDDGDNVDESHGVRPVFYLKSDVKITADSGIDGSVDKPYRVN